MLRDLTLQLRRGVSTATLREFGRALGLAIPYALPVSVVEDVDVASIAANASLTTNVALAGVSVGDVVTGVAFPTGLPAGIQFVHANIEAPDVVRLTLRNTTGDAVNPPPMDVHFVVVKHAA